MTTKRSRVWVLTCLLVLIGGHVVHAKVRENAKIYTVFANKGCSCPAGGTPEGLVTNDQVLEQLQSRCPGVDFISRDLTKAGTSLESILDELENSKQDLDGVLIIGVSREYRLALTGLPTIVVYNLWEWMNVPYKLYQTGKEEDSVLVGGVEHKRGRVITAQLDRRNVCSPSLSEAMFQDLADKVRLIEAIKRLKETKILVVTPLPYLALVDYQGDLHKHLPENYNEIYTAALKDSLGVELVRVEPEEFYEAVRNVDEQQAREIAQMWIAAAQGLKDTTVSEVVKTAKSYLAFDAVRKKYDCDGISTFMRTLTGSDKVEDMFWPGLGLMEFQKRGIQAVCQNYPNILVTHLLGYYITGRPSMLGDLMIDTFNNTSILTHCGAPINPWGDERRIPYVIWSHAQSPVRNTLRPGSGTGAQVNYPANEPVTIWKVYVLHKKIGLYTGTTVDGHSLYRDFDAIMCRTKLVARVDGAKKIQRKFSPDEYGIHRAATLGDLRERIRDFATLVGFELVEEDR